MLQTQITDCNTEITKNIDYVTWKKLKYSRKAIQSWKMRVHISNVVAKIKKKEGETAVIFNNLEHLLQISTGLIGNVRADLLPTQAP